MSRETTEIKTEGEAAPEGVAAEATPESNETGPPGSFDSLSASADNTPGGPPAEPSPAASPEPAGESAAPQISVAGAEPEIVADRSGEEVKLILGEFAGPLDLLLYLIRQEQVDIIDIPIARITDEYLRYLRLMQNTDIAVASDFLVMAATLIEIKSKTLLPADPLLALVEGADDDPRRELINQLLEHQKFKAAAEMLWSRATVEQAVFTRAPLETDKNNPEVSAGVFDLLRVFQEILARKKEEVLMEIERDEMTMAEMLERLRNMIRSAGELNLRRFFEQTRSRRELVLAFLSVLEIVRTTEIVLIQSKTFGDITARMSV
ncbi:MAG TPA: segregation/condensation protein A [Pyrinomonadaceae bacterium]|nr:segregation/condensation protein A [Pyrinomonadaceae bacterium]